MTISGDSQNPAERFCFPPTSRLRTKSEFNRVYSARCKAGDGTVLMFLCPNEQTQSRLGLSVSRKVGSAVVRNRLKRLLREAFRLQQHALPQGVDLIMIPAAVDKASLPQYQQSLRRLSQRLWRKWQQQALPQTAPEQPGGSTGSLPDGPAVSPDTPPLE